MKKGDVLNDKAKRLREINKETAKLLRYIKRSNQTIAKNTRKLKKLQREQEILLNPPLPGLDS